MEGFIRTAAGAPRIRIADPDRNANVIIEMAGKAAAEGASLLCLPELCLTGRTCGDLFLQSDLIKASSEALIKVAAQCAPLDLLLALGLPFGFGGKLYNCTALAFRGRLLGIVPKAKGRRAADPDGSCHFTEYTGGLASVDVARSSAHKCIPFGADIIFISGDDSCASFAVVTGDETYEPFPQSARLAAAGAAIIVNPAAAAETAGASKIRRDAIRSLSGRLKCGYAYAGAGHGESTTDGAYSGHILICESGGVLCESPPFKGAWAISDIDIDAIAYDRKRFYTNSPNPETGYHSVYFDGGVQSAAPPAAKLIREFDAMPFLRGGVCERADMCEEILDIQAAGLFKRLEHTECGKVIIGISGGLDSSLALLAVVRALNKSGRPLSDINAITMPCFGTSDRTKGNAFALCGALNVHCREIAISGTVMSHFGDIGQSEDSYDIAYENAQARIRTLTLMDIANAGGGLVIGPGDLSELALGYVTYGGDHMSMYAINSGIPKTVVMQMVSHIAETCGDENLKGILRDILSTPISAELLPPVDGMISQLTEERIGPYELHDFIIYHALRYGRSARKIFDLAAAVFERSYSKREILKWMKVFYRRFVSQQFKRNCMPDGLGVFEISMSPRNGLKMPSDAASDVWIRELAALERDCGS